MSPRLYANITYAWLAEGLPPEMRDKLDRELTAPVGGWDEAQRRAFARLADLAEPGPDPEGGG